MTDSVAHLPDLINQQRAQLAQWRNEAPDSASLVANEAWQALQRELDAISHEGLLWDFAKSTRYSLLMTLTMGVDAACEKWIDRRIESLSADMQCALGAAWQFDATCASINSLRAGLHVRQRLEPQFEQLFKTAQPPLPQYAASALLDDEQGAIELMDKDALKDAARLQAVFQVAKDDIVQEICGLIVDLLQRSIRIYQDALLTAALQLPEAPSV